MPDAQDEQKQAEHIRQIVADTVKQELEKKPAAPSSTLSPEEQKTAIDCTNAHNIALQTLHYAQQLGANFSGPENFNIMQDCADCCELMNHLILRQSPLVKDFAALCMKACTDCLRLAENFTEDPQMQALIQYVKIASESLKPWSAQQQEA